MERRRAVGERHSLRETVAIVVPLCVEVADRHARGERLYLTPSCVTLDGTARVDPQLARQAPVLPRDRACLAPEERSGQAGDARASVYAIGALVYELVTGETVGPAMRRPTEIVPNLDPGVEVILGKALVGDRSRRPDDLGALAQALHHLAPMASIAPPPADESHLDQGEDFTVDVSLSMLPPPPKGPSVPAPAPPPSVRGGAPSASGEAARAQQRSASRDPVARLSDLKARLESDPRPRYVVVKDGMDHGPFSAVELLQQIGSHTFEEDHVLRDAFSNDERPIKDWEEFAPFAEQAKLHREVVAEKKELERAVVAETRGNRRTMVVAGASLAAVAALLVGWQLTSRGLRQDAISVAADHGVAVETDAGLKGAVRKTPSGGGGVAAAAGGNYPVLSGGMSCEAAQEKYVQEINIGGSKGPADLTAGQFGSILNNGSYVVACGTPQSTHVHVCAAVQNGRAVGVTVTTDPPSPGIASCIAGKVRAMSFPSSPRLDIARTNF
jgi:hypothetical protein